MCVQVIVTFILRCFDRLQKNFYQAGSQEVFDKLAKYKFNRGLVVAVPLAGIYENFGGAAAFGDIYYSTVKGGIPGKAYYHHAFVAEGTDPKNSSDRIYFVAQFGKGDVIPSGKPIQSADFQVNYLVQN